MDATVLARARSVINPFVSNRVDSAWDPDAVDVEAINRTAFECCRETIELARSTGRCRGLLLSGEPGSGKTHLLHRLRRRVQRDGRDYFVYVPPVSGPDRFFHDVLQRTVQDLVGSRPGSPSSQLESLLVRELLRAETGEQATPEAFWGDVRTRYPPGEALHAWLEAPMQTLCVLLDLDPEVTRALQHYLGEHRRFEAYSWLLGRSVRDEILTSLNVSRTLEDDGDARRALGTLSRLTGAHSVLVMAFDQLEGLQVDAQDQHGLRAFAAGLATLFVECRNIATISCVQTYFKQDLERAVPPAHMDRLAQDQGALTRLDGSTANQLVAERLRVVGELSAAREALGAQHPLWPLHREDVERAITAGGIPARQLLNYCRDLFEQWRRGAAPVPPTESLDDVWEAKRKLAAAEPAEEGVLVDGLLKLLDARSPGTCKRGTVRDVDLVISALGGEIGVAVCHAENMTSLAARLRRLQSVAESGRFRRLVIVRDERLRISPSAKTTRERLGALQQAGHAVLRPPAEAYAAVAAARQLLAEAAAGDLSLNGTPVVPEDLKAWLNGHLDAAPAELLSALERVGATEPSDIVERVQESLEEPWVRRAADVAADMGLAESALVGHLTAGQHAIGVLTGPPTVLFLRPEGLRRG